MSVVEQVEVRGLIPIRKISKSSSDPFYVSPVSAYQREIPHKFLTIEDERSCGAAIQIYRGIIRAIASQVPKIRGARVPHNEKVEVHLMKTMQDLGQSYPTPEFYLFAYVVSQGLSAIEKLMEPNYRLVIDTAWDYQDCCTPGLKFGDLIGAGNFGLRRAAFNFDYRLGFRFITYAKDWIRQGITREIEDHSRVIRLPSNRTQDFSRYIKTQRRLQGETSDLPSDTEVAREMNVSLSRIDNGKAVQFLNKVLSLDAAVPQDGISSRDQTGTNALSIEEQCAKKELRAQLFYVMNMSDLTEIEKKVLCARYGFAGRLWKPTEFGKCIGLTREKVCWIETKALRKLRACVLERLEAYLE